MSRVETTGNDTAPDPGTTPAQAAAPTESTSAGASPASAQGRGCRRCLIGCLGMIVVLTILVTVGGWFGYTRYARPWFLGMRERVYETVPQLEALEGVILGGGGLSDLERDLSGSTDPAAFPEDVALPENPEILTTRSNDLGARAVVETEGRTVAAITEALRSEMQSLGWSRVTVPDPDDGVALRFERTNSAGLRIAVYELVPQDNARVRVWVRVTRRERPPGPPGPR